MSTQTITIKGRHFDAVTGMLVPRSRPLPVVTPRTAKHVTKPSSTLMRAAVKKPSARISHVQPSIAEGKQAAQQNLSSKLSVTSVDPVRSERARQVVRSEKVSRFGEQTTSGLFSSSVAHVPVRLAPKAPEQTEPNAPEPQRTNDPEDIFMRAIASASNFVDVKALSAKQRRAVRRHIASMATGFAALLLIAGFAAYINMPGLQMRVAGIEAGVSAMQPDFAKAGFAYNGVQAGDGKRTIGLTAHGYDYRLVERATNWDGETMIRTISSVSANGTPNYTAVKVGSHTVYRFNDRQATWVKNGTWYHFNGDAAFSDRELAALVRNS